MDEDRFKGIITFLHSLHLRQGGVLINDDNTLLECATEIYIRTPKGNWVSKRIEKAKEK